MSWKLLSLSLLLLNNLLFSSLYAENWPGWRGVRGDGTSSEAELPIRWSPTENVRWKVSLDGEGHSSPIVWGDYLFVTSCNPEKLERILHCFNSKSGAKLWETVVLRSPLEIKHGLNSYASSTPATDGELVFVTFWETSDKQVPALNVSDERGASFGAMVVAAYDFSGKQRWVVRPGDFTSVHGFCSNPVVHGDKLIINGDHDGAGYIVALDRRTGETLWKTARDFNTRSYVTPIIRTFENRTQLILSGSRHVASYDPDTGKEFWRMAGPTEQFVASMVDNGRYVFLTAGYPDKHILAIDPTGSGDVGTTHIAWRSNRNCSYVPAPVVVSNHLMLTSDDGVASCYNADSGERLWFARAGGHYSGSPVTANGLAYFTDDNGVTKVIRPGAKLDVVAENKLDESCYSSPAISDGAIYFRTDKSVICIAQSKN